MCKLTEKCFSYIIKELLYWYWWILALVGFKMHSQARAFLQPTRANIHQYQFNNPIIYHLVNNLIIIKLTSIVREVLWVYREHMNATILFQNPFNILNQIARAQRPCYTEPKIYDKAAFPWRVKNVELSKFLIQFKSFVRSWI